MGLGSRRGVSIIKNKVQEIMMTLIVIPITIRKVSEGTMADYDLNSGTSLDYKVGTVGK